MNFEEIYNDIQIAKKLYEKDKEAGRALYHKATAPISEFSRAEYTIWKAYKTSRDYENEYIDFNDNIRAEDVEDLVSGMKDRGIKAFTFSSVWSKAIETAMLFQQTGCTLMKLVEINGHYETPLGIELEKAPAYLFKI